MLEKKISPLNLFLLTSLTLIFFAANSLLCKAALVDNHIDAFSFTFLRLFFASVVLLLILLVTQRKVDINIKTNWLNAFFLFLYAIAFSYSYINLDAGLGALVLFASVQLTIVAYAFFKKEQISSKKIFGIILAFSGLVYLLFPKDDFSISIFHFFLMVISGIGWGFYTILGKKSQNVLKDTSDNFIKALLFVLAFFLFFVDFTKFSSYGVFLAFLSGGIASGIGYSLWYFVLRNIQIVTASAIQLIVPVIAIFLSILLLEEKLTFSLIFSSILILSGIFIAIYKKS